MKDDCVSMWAETHRDSEFTGRGSEVQSLQHEGELQHGPPSVRNVPSSLLCPLLPAQGWELNSNKMFSSLLYSFVVQTQMKRRGSVGAALSGYYNLTSLKAKAIDGSYLHLISWSER